MPELESSDGAYVCADQGDGNFVVYDKRTEPWKAVWDRWSYEASKGRPPKTGNNPSPSPAPPIIKPPPSPPSPPSPPPSAPALAPNPVKIADNANSIGMAYWRNINHHAGRDNFLAALSFNDEIHILTVRKRDLHVIDVKPLGIHHTGEGINFSAHRHDVLYVPLDDTLIAVNVFTRDRSEIWRADNNDKLWQVHMSYDEQVFSATMKNSNYEVIGWGVYKDGVEKRFPIRGVPDECQIDKSGEYLLIKEDNYNKIIRLANGREIFINDLAGALGHSDCGFRCAMGENNMSNSPGALDIIDFETGKHWLMFSTGIWNMGYVSFTNAMPDMKGQICLLSTPNELIAVNFDWPHEARIICQNLTQDQSYENRPKANLCPLGQYAIWTAYVDNSLNAYVVRIPN